MTKRPGIERLWRRQPGVDEETFWLAHAMLWGSALPFVMLGVFAIGRAAGVW